MNATSQNTTQHDYYAQKNILFLALLWVHLGFSLLTAYLCNQSLTLAITMSLAILSLPTFLVWQDRKSLTASIANAVALVSFSALLIHLSGGMTELHFHIFASLGLMITLAQPLASTAALLFVVVHHLGFFFFLPKSLINYDAGFGILVVHAVFALSIGVPAIFIARKFKTYIIGVKEIAAEIQGIATGLADSSSTMLENADTLSTSTKKEAAAVSTTASSLDQLNAMNEKNSASAQNVANSSEESKVKSSHGLQVMTEMVTAMTEIKSNSQEILGALEQGNNRMQEIISLIQQIGSKTQVINDIVFQTKLLSFNASVEAARAGEYGKGFAVVAEEVGKLAQMSGTSAKEISDLLQTSVRNVESIIEKNRTDIESIVSGGQAKINTGLQVAEEGKTVLTDIDHSLTEVSQLAAEIAGASKEQATGIKEISKAINEVEVASQQNNNVSSQTAEVASSLNQDTQNLNHAISRLIAAVENGVSEDRKKFSA